MSLYDLNAPSALYNDNAGSVDVKNFHMKKKTLKMDRFDEFVWENIPEEGEQRQPVDVFWKVYTSFKKEGGGRAKALVSFFPSFLVFHFSISSFFSFSL